MADNTGTLLMVGIVLVLAYLFIQGNPDILGQGQSGVDDNVNNYYYYNNQPAHVNLAAMYSPYITTNHTTMCAAVGGTWFNSATKVGCFNTVIALNYTAICTTPAIQATNSMCTAAGGTVACNLHNLGCYYS